MSTPPLVSSINLEITKIGDVILRRGDLPAYSDQGPPLWAHRATGTSDGGKADGGIGCKVESWWMHNVMEDEDIPVEMSVDRGRWRVGRGRFCTMGQSPKPDGFWKGKLPGSARGTGPLRQPPSSSGRAGT